MGTTTPMAQKRAAATILLMDMGSPTTRELSIFLRTQPLFPLLGPYTRQRTARDLMKTLLVTVALTLVAVSSSAAIQYEFVQKNTSADPVEPVTDLTARAVVDGDRSRVDFLSGNLYPPGTYV